MPLLGIAVTAGARHTAHLITLLVDIVVIGGLCIYTSFKAKEREIYFGRWHKYGPSILVWVALPLIIADPLRHVLEDYKVWQGCERSCGETWPSSCTWSSSEYKCYLQQTCESDGTTWCPGFYPPPSDPNQACNGLCVHHETINHLSMIGVVFTICCTWVGMLMFITGSLWNANICEKCQDLRDKWREIRAERAARGGTP